MAGFGGLNPNLTDLAYLTPGIDPGHQSGWDTFSPPVGRIPGGVTITECTRKAAANQLIILTGDGFTSSTYFAFYGQSTAGNGTLVKDTSQAKNLLLDATNNSAAVVIPGTLPSGAIMIWAVDGGKISAPLLLNTAICWRAQDMGTGLRASAIPGNTISVYGLNLANGSTTWIYLEVLNGTPAAMFVTATAANEDRVQFTLPTGAIGAHGALALNDTVRVWIHNGGGGKYGWSKVPYDLTVTTLANLGLTYPSSGATINPANGGSSTSTADTSNLTTRISSIGGSGGSITLGPGTFYLNSITFIGGGASAISLEGAGSGSDPSTNTIVKVLTGAGYTDAGSAAWLTFFPGGRIKNIRFDTTGGATFGSNGAIICSNVTNCTIINSNAGSDIALNVGGPPGYSGSAGSISGTTIQAKLPIYGNAWYQLAMSGMTLLVAAGEDDAAMICAGGGPNFLSDVSIDTVTITELSSRSNRGRAFVTEAITNYFYLDGINATLAPINNDPAGAGGECFFLGEQQVEGAWNSCSSNSTGTATTVTFPSGHSVPTARMIVKVVSGKGIGQCGLVTSVSGLTVTLDQLWKVDINTSSILHTNSGVAYFAMRNCTTTSAGITSESASSGWQINQQAAYFHISGHASTGCNTGYSLLANQLATSGNGNYSGSGQCGTFSWGLIENATVRNCGWDENLGTEGGNGAVWPTHIGTVIRATTATGPSITTEAIHAGENNANFSSSSLNLLGHDACSYSDATVAVTEYPGIDHRDIWWNTAIPAPVGATTGLSLSGGSTGANFIFRGTGGVTGYSNSATDKAATP